MLTCAAENSAKVRTNIPVLLIHLWLLFNRHIKTHKPITWKLNLKNDIFSIIRQISTAVIKHITACDCSLQRWEPMSLYDGFLW